MGRIIFLNCFPRDYVSGGIKTMYQHAFLLRQSRFAVQVLQADGAPTWLGPEMASMVCASISNLTAQDILVFPEVLEGWYEDLIRSPVKARKVIFCQNPYYFVTFRPSLQKLKQWGVSHILTPSRESAFMLQRMLGLEDVLVTSPMVDGELFRPGQKKPQIVVNGWKWAKQGPLPDYVHVISNMLGIKYPQFADASWVVLKGKSEAEVAALMGESAICLSLGRLESLGMTALEAMAAGCLVVGYHGGGGRDYATSQNGFWHSPEDIEGVVDSLALALADFTSGNPVLTKMLEHGLQTASHYGPRRVTEQLKQVYGQLRR